MINKWLMLNWIVSVVEVNGTTIVATYRRSSSCRRNLWNSSNMDTIMLFMHKRDQSDDSANRSPRNGLAHMHNGICQCGINSPPLSWEGTASSWKVDHSARLQLGLYSKIQQVLHQSFVYTQLNERIVLFQAIQFYISHLLLFSLNVKQFYLTHR